MDVADPLFDWNSAGTSTGSAGANGSGFSFDKFFGNLSGLATGVGQAVSAFKGGTKSNDGKAAAAKSTASNWTAYLPWIIGGAVVLLGLAFFLFRGKGK